MSTTTSPAGAPAVTATPSTLCSAGRCHDDPTSQIFDQLSQETCGSTAHRLSEVPFGDRLLTHRRFARRSFLATHPEISSPDAGARPPAPRLAAYCRTTLAPWVNSASAAAGLPPSMREFGLYWTCLPRIHVQKGPSLAPLPRGGCGSGISTRPLQRVFAAPVQGHGASNGVPGGVCSASSATRRSASSTVARVVAQPNARLARIRTSLSISMVVRFTMHAAPRKYVQSCDRVIA